MVRPYSRGSHRDFQRRYALQPANSNDRPEASPPRRRVSAREWAEGCDQEEQRRQEKATAKRLATRARNAVRFPPTKLLPKTVKHAKFYFNPKLSRDWFPDEHHFWRACYIVSTIHLHWVWKWKYRHRKGGPGYVHLVHDYIRRVIGRSEWKTIKTILLGRGYLECDNTAIPGEKAYGWRIADEYRDGIRLFPCTDKAFSRRMTQIYTKDRQYYQPEHHRLRDWLDRVGIDREKAREAAHRLKLKRRKRKVGKGQQPYTLQTYHKDQERCIQVIADREHFLAVNDYGRVTTSISQLKRELVPYLYFDLKEGREPIVWADVSACQPLLSILLALHYYSSSRMVLSRLCNRTYDCTKPYRPADRSLNSLLHTDKEGKEGREATSLYEGKPSLSPNDSNDLQIPLPVTPVPGGEDPDLAVLRKCKQICEEGRLYQQFMTEEEQARGKGYQARFKVRFLAMLYVKDNPRHPNALRGRFAVMFPPWASFMAVLRRKDHRRAARLMQNTEATVFIHRICGRILREKPDIPLVTKHDALGTTPRHIAYVCRVIQEEFRRLGANPTIKVTGAGLTAIIREGLSRLGNRIRIEGEKP